MSSSLFVERPSSTQQSRPDATSDRSHPAAKRAIVLLLSLLVLFGSLDASPTMAMFCLGFGFRPRL